MVNRALMANVIKRASQSSKDMMTEEATKQSLILPFVAALGYDIFNPTEVVPEHSVAFGAKASERVDYAIYREGVQVIIVEAKPVYTTLNSAHISQLYKYFTPNEARHAILTNGITYKFFSDIKSINILDEVPYYTLDINNITEFDYDFLDLFSKSQFDLNKIRKSAVAMKYETSIVDTLKKQMSKPTKGFIQTMLSESGIVSDIGLDEASQIIMSSLVKFMQSDNDLSLSTDANIQKSVEGCVMTVAESECINNVKNIIKNDFGKYTIDTDVTKWYTNIKARDGERSVKIVTLFRNGAGADIWGFSFPGYSGAETSGSRNSIKFESPGQILEYSGVILELMQVVDTGVKSSRGLKKLI